MNCIVHGVKKSQTQLSDFHYLSDTVSPSDVSDSSLVLMVLKNLMLKLKLQYFGYLMRRTKSLEKTLMPGKIEGRRRRG